MKYMMCSTLHKSHICHAPISSFFQVYLLCQLIQLSTAPVHSTIATAVGVSVSVTFVVSFSMGVLVAYVLYYISRRFKESPRNPGSHSDPTTVYDEVGTNKKTKRDDVEMDANIAYGSHVSQIH